MNQHTKYKIFILLQQHKGTIPNLYKLIKGSIYNHASISTDPNIETFYSFRTKWGFCIEHPFDFKKKHKESIQCSIYEIEVSEENYFRVQESLNQFLLKKGDLKYSYLGLILGFLKIKHFFERSYYCSRFVAEVMKASESIKLKKDTSLYLPSDFKKESFKLHFEGQAKEFNRKLSTLATCKLSKEKS